jgi:hypothetical protein
VGTTKAWPRRSHSALLSMIVAAIVCAGCTSSHSSAAPSKAPIARSRAPSAALSHRPTGSTTCRRSALELSTELYQEGAGHASTRLIFENTSRRPCSITGTPQIRFESADGRSVGSTIEAYPGPKSAGTVRLAPDQRAASILTFGNPAMMSSQVCRVATTKMMLVRLRPWSRPMTIVWLGRQCTVRRNAGGVMPVEAIARGH